MAESPDKKKRLGDMLVQEGLLTQTQLDQAVELQRAKGGRLGDILVEMKHCTEDQVLSLLAKKAGVPFVSSLSAYGKLAPEVLSLISGDLARRWGVVPLGREGTFLTVALADPFVELNAVDDLRMHTGHDIKMVLTSGREIQKAVQTAYPEPATENPLTSDRFVGEDLDRQRTIILDALIGSAVKTGADHVYLEPGPGSLRVRCRVHGALQSKPDLPLHHHAPLVSHIKRWARLDGSQRRLAQEGRMRGTWAGRPLEVRVSILPTADGEKVVLSFLDSARALPLDLEGLGLDEDLLAPFRKLMDSQRGLFLVAGPPRSGKTATLYAALASMNAHDRHIMTMEDPIDRYLDGVTQLQAHAGSGLTLASGLHLLRRQNPDVIMVGGLRDADVTEAAVEVAGECLVLSSVSASHALGALQKLLEMGVAPSALADRLIGVLGQRLVKKICLNCREPQTMSLRELMAAGMGDKEIRAAKRAATFTVYRGRGCGRCWGTGYEGVAAVFELLPVTDNLRRLIAERASGTLISRETAERVTLREAAMKKVLSGETSMEEALRD